MSGSLFSQAFHTYSSLTGVVFSPLTTPLASCSSHPSGLSLDATYHPNIVLKLDAHSFIHSFIQHIYGHVTCYMPDTLTARIQ